MVIKYEGILLEPRLDMRNVIYWFVVTFGNVFLMK